MRAGFFFVFLVLGVLTVTTRGAMDISHPFVSQRTQYMDDSPDLAIFDSFSAI